MAALALQIKASVLNHDLRVAGVKEATALGAALLGGIAASVYADLAEAGSTVPIPYAELSSHPAQTAFYDQAFRSVYRPLYPTLRPLHDQIYRLSTPARPFMAGLWSGAGVRRLYAPPAQS